MSNSKNLDPRYLQYNAVSDLEQNNKVKLELFILRISPFKHIKSLKDAKELAAKILPTANELNRFYIGSAKCIIVNKKDLFRISLITEKEFISYSF